MTAPPPRRNDAERHIDVAGTTFALINDNWQWCQEFAGEETWFLVSVDYPLGCEFLDRIAELEDVKSMNELRRLLGQGYTLAEVWAHQGSPGI